MSKKLYPETDIQNIANAIRNLNGSSDTYTVSEMASAIALPENAYYLKESASANPLSITDGEELKCQSALVTFSPKQSGTGDPSPSNIRPISGRDSLVLNQSGKNQFNPQTLVTAGATKSGDVYNFAQGVITTNTKITDVPKADEQYVLKYKMKTINANTNLYLYFKYTDGTITRVVSGGTANAWNDRVLVSDSSKTIDGIYINQYSSPFETSFTDIQLEFGSVPTEYEPYSGSTHTATFPSTIMGGSYDFVSGVLKNGWSNKVDLGKLNWTYMSNYSIFTAYIPPAKQNADCVCDSYAYSGTSVGATRPDKTINVGIKYFSSSFNVVSVKDTSYTSAEDFKTAMNGVYVCYKLATPQEITLPPETIELLKDLNTVWTDGDSVQIKYWSKSNTVPLLNMLPMGTMNISNINNENNGNEVEEIPVEESKESLEEIENIDNSENE